MQTVKHRIQDNQILTIQTPAASNNNNKKDPKLVNFRSFLHTV